MPNDAELMVGIRIDDSQATRSLQHLASFAGRAMSKSISTHTQPLGRITGEANEFQKSLAASNARVIAFGASTGVIFAMKSAFQQLVRSTIEVEKEMSEMNAIFQMGSQQIKGFSNELFAVANAYGMAFSEASSAAAEFARQGLTVEETLKRTAAALALSRVSGTSMEQSVSSLTSILNTFVKESLDAEQVINRLVAVDQAYAVSAGDLAEALSRVSSSAADANVSLNQTMGLITAAKQITARSGSVIGNSFKTMFTRLQRPQVLDDLEAVGVKARDTQGKIRPMMDILKNLATSYDTLGSAQKSFVAETVGGVYQINILKAIMRDLGSGMSIVDGAMEAAGNSADFVNKRMEILNETISSQLIRTANNLKLTFYNVGTALISGSMKSGIGNFDSLVRNVGKYSDSTTAKEGSGGEQFAANALQGGLKGIGNFLKGPGVQFIMFALLKLFQRLETFILQSAKELVGINQKEKQREAINQGIAEWLGNQKELLQDILSGQRDVNDAAKLYLEEMKGAVSLSKELKSIAGATGDIVVNQVSFMPKTGAAGGYIPNLEIAEARRGGYQAGRVMDTTISNGFQRINVVANGAESMTRVMQDGRAFDFINPPPGTPAANMHRRESINQTGIDPYEMPRMPIRGRGFIPNLSLPPELVTTISNLGVNIDQVRGRNKMEDFLGLNEHVVNTFVSRYRHDPKSLSAALKSLVLRGDNLPLNNGPAMNKYLQGLMLRPDVKQAGLFPDMSLEAVQALAKTLTGKEAESPSKTLARISQATSLRPEDIQRVLNLHGATIPFITAYEHSGSFLNPAKDRPHLVSPLDVTVSNTKHRFKVPTPMFGFKGGVMQKWAEIEKQMQAATGSDEPFTAGEIGTTRGTFFDKSLRAMAQKEGVGVGKPGSSLDIYGAVKSILSRTNITGPVAAMELKASASEALSSGNMAEKIFRTLAGEPVGAGASLKGPVGHVPKLVNIKQFDMTKGGIGIIDADKSGIKGAGAKAAYNSLIYAAVASGKPIRVHYGPMTMGKTTAAENIVQAAGGMGDKGGGYVTEMQQIDSDQFKQFIINKTDRTHMDTGVFGLALSAASQVRAFYSPYTEYQAKHQEMVRRLQERNRGSEGQHAEAIANKYDESSWTEYAANISHLTKKLGPERVGMFDPDKPFAGRGFIPNLANPLFKQQNFSAASWDEENGVLDIEGIYRSRGENPMMTLGRFIAANAPKIREIKMGSIVGPKVPKMVQTFLQRAGGIEGLAGAKLTGEFSPSILVAEGSIAARRGDISKVDFRKMVQAMKFLGVDDFKTMKPFRVNRTLAKGFVPNLFPKNAEIAEGSGYTPLTSANAFQLRAISMGLGMDTNMAPTDMAQEISQKHPGLFKKLWLNGMFNFPDAKASGFVPNLAKSWPVFPEFDTASPGGVPVRRSSMGVSDSYWDRKVQVEMARIQKLASSTDKQAVLKTLISRYGPEYGAKIKKLLSRKESEKTQTSLQNNVKGFLGERHVARMLSSSGGVSNLTKLPEKQGFDFTGEGDEDDFLFEVKNQGKIGNYSKFKKKIITGHANYPQRVKWLIGNDDTHYTGRGFVPNMSLDIDSMSQFFTKGPGSRWDAEGIFADISRSAIEGFSPPYITEGRTKAQEISLARKYSQTDSADNYWTKRMYELTRRGNVRGAVANTSKAIRKIAAQNNIPLNRNTYKLLRRLALDISKAHVAQHGATNIWGGSLRDIVTRHLGPYYEKMFSPSKIFDAMLEQRTPKATEFVSDPVKEEAKTLNIARNSSNLVVTNKKLYVDFLRRQAYMHMPTGAIFQEANPLKAIYTQIKRGEINSVEATVIGAKIPNILKSMVEMGQAGHLPKGFEFDFGWTPSALSKNAEEDMKILPKALQERERWKEGSLDPRRPSYDEYDFKRISGYMTEEDLKQMHEAMRFFGHDPMDSKRFSYRKAFGKGFIPNFYAAASEALARENKATGGNAILSSNPLLRTNQNPLGLAAIDRRSQSNAGEAIRQHIGLGQSMSEVRQAHTARGFVPNLASPYDQSFGTGNQGGGVFSSMGLVNSVIMAVLGAARQEAAAPSKKMDIARVQGFGIEGFWNKISVGWMKRFSTDGERLASAVRLIQREFEAARENLRRGKDVTMTPMAGGATFKGTDRDRIKAMDAEAKRVLSVIGPKARDYEEQQKASAARASKFGIRGATISSIGGGLASQFAELSSPSLGDAVNEFSSGMTTASQLLLTFPNRFGWITAIGTAAGAAISGVDVWRKGLQNAIRSFEIANTKYEKLSAQMDALSVSLNQYDSMIMDASVSAEAIGREQRKYAETLSQMKETEGGPAIAARLEAAPDTRARMSVLVEEKDRATRKNELAASVTALQKYGTGRMFAGSSLLGINPFGYTNKTNQATVEHLMRSVGGASIANMSAPLKSMLMASTSVDDFSKKLQDAADHDPNPEIQKSAAELIAAFGDLTDKFGERGMGTIRKEIFGQLQTEREDTTPAKTKARLELRQRQAERQEQIDAAINTAKTAQRFFVNSGALQAGSQLDVRSMMQMRSLNTQLVYGRGSIAERQAGMGVMRQQYGERTVRQYEAATDVGRMTAERQFKVGQIQTESTRGIVGQLTQDFESKIKNPELYKQAGTPGGAVPTISDFGADFLTALNKGIASIVKGGNLNRFVGPSGQMDMIGMQKAIAASSGPNLKMQGNVLRYLQANSSIDIMKSILEANKQIASVTEESGADIARRLIELNGTMKELDFNRLAEYAGGIKNLLDRSSRRTMQRNLVRGAFLMERGRTPEARATGAALFLETIKQMGQPLDPNKNTGLSQSIKKAFSVLTPNLAIVQQRTMNMAAGSINRLNPGSTMAKGLQDLASQAGLATAQAAVEKAFPSESTAIAGGAQADISSATKRMNEDLFASDRALVGFTTTIDMTRDAWFKALEAMKEVRNRLTKEGAADAERTMGGPAGTQAVARATSTGGPDSVAKALAVATGPSWGTLAGIGGATIASIIYGFAKKRQGAQSKEMLNLLKSINAAMTGAGTEAAVVTPTIIERMKGSVSKNYQKFSGRTAMAEKASAKAAQEAERVATIENYKQFRKKQTMPVYTEIESSGLGASAIPETMQSLSAAQKKALYAQQQGAKKHARNMGIKEKADINRRYLEGFQKEVQIPSTAIEANVSRPPITDVEGTKLFERWMPKAQQGDKKAISKMLSRFGKGKGLAIGGLMLAGMALPSLAQASQGQTIAGVGTPELMGVGMSAGMNTMMMKGSMGLKKGGLAGAGLAITDVFTDKIGDAIGGTAGEVFKTTASIGSGATMMGLGGMGAAGKFGLSGGALGAIRGGGGVGIGIASELLRRNFTEKRFGYTAGAGQGMGGAMLAGAAFGGPIGAAIGGAAYGVTEGIQMRAETNAAVGEGKGLDAVHLLRIAQNIGGTDESNVKQKGEQIMGNLFNRQKQLKGYQESDESDFSGYSGKMMALFHVSKRQFGESESKELSKVTEQKERLGQAIMSGDTKQMIRVLQDIQGELSRQAKDILTPEKTQGTASQINSKINVDISVKDMDRIPSEIRDTVIGPIAQQLADLQMTVNELVNQRSPRPASLG